MALSLANHNPEGRNAALASGESMPDITKGFGLFASISGFTSLTETFTRQLDARRGIQELIRRIDAVYDAIC